MDIAETTRQLRKTAKGTFVFESITKPLGIAKLFASGEVIERSTWKFDQGRFVPLEYEYDNSDSKSKRNVRLKFDWESKKVTNIINGEPWKMTLSDETLDKLLYQLVLMHELQQSNPKLDYQVADGGSMKTYNIEMEGRKKIKLDLGEFDTQVISRTRGSRKTIFWCDKDMFYLPVRIEQHKDGSVIRADLVSVNGIDLP